MAGTVSWTEIVLVVRTPMFIGAASPTPPSPAPARGRAEHLDLTFPVPSLRGALRFWLRALIGAHLPVAPESLTALADVERQVFGVASREERSAERAAERTRERSAERDAQVSTPPGPRSQSAVVIRARGTVPFVPPGSRPPWLGTEDGRAGYLLGPGLWSPKEGLRGYVEPGREIPLAVRIDGRAQHQEAVGDLLAAALWALVTFGGLGSRARRGLGTVQIARVGGAPLAGRRFDPTWLAEPLVGDPVDRLDAVLECVGEVLADLAVPGLADEETVDDGPPLYPCFCPGFYWTGDRAGIGRGLGDFGRALAGLGGQFRDFRTGGDTRTDDYRALVSPWMDERPLAAGRPFENAALGLPIVFHRKGTRANATVSPRLGGRRGTELRRASPLWLRPYPTPSGQWRLRSLALVGQFLPPEAELVISGTRATGNWDSSVLTRPDQDLVEDVIDRWFARPT